MNKKKEECLGKGQLFVVGTPIGNLGDITIRAVETLKMVDVILAEDTRQTKKLLVHLMLDKPCISYHRHNEVEKIQRVKQLLDEGKNIALVSDAGMPRISDPGEKLIQTLKEEKYIVQIIPGVTAITTALVGCQFDIERFVFEGFLPMHTTRRKARLNVLKNEERVIVFYEAPHKLLATLKDLQKTFGDRRICIARELTKIYEEYRQLTVSQAITYVEENGVKGEIVLLVEGKKEIQENVEEKPSSLVLIKQVKEYEKQGMTKNDAIKQVAKNLGLKKQEVYMECVKNGIDSKGKG